MKKMDRLYKKALKGVKDSIERCRFKKAIKVAPVYFEIVSHCYTAGIELPEVNRESESFYREWLDKLGCDVSIEEFMEYFSD